MTLSPLLLPLPGVGKYLDWDVVSSSVRDRDPRDKKEELVEVNYGPERGVRRDTDKIRKENQTKKGRSCHWSHFRMKLLLSNKRRKKGKELDTDLSAWYQQVLYFRLSFSFSGPIY